jgi:ABC-type multidrug transport system fused ATPase/permease subunit
VFALGAAATFVRNSSVHMAGERIAARWVGHCGPHREAVPRPRHSSSPLHSPLFTYPFFVTNWPLTESGVLGLYYSRYIAYQALALALHLSCACAVEWGSGLTLLTDVAGVDFRLRKRVFAAILHQKTAFFDTNRTGELINRLSNDVTQVSKVSPPTHLSAAVG